MATKFNWHTYQQQTAVWQAEQRGIAKSRQTAEERARQRVLLAERDSVARLEEAEIKAARAVVYYGNTPAGRLAAFRLDSIGESLEFHRNVVTRMEAGAPPCKSCGSWLCFDPSCNVTAELEATLIRKAQRRADELEVERSRRMV
jgi:hypothetical protein